MWRFRQEWMPGRPSSKRVASKTLQVWLTQRVPQSRQKHHRHECPAASCVSYWFSRPTCPSLWRLQILLCKLIPRLPQLLHKNIFRLMAYLKPLWHKSASGQWFILLAVGDVPDQYCSYSEMMLVSQNQFSRILESLCLCSEGHGHSAWGTFDVQHHAVGGKMPRGLTYCILINQWFSSLRSEDKVLIGQLYHFLLNVKVPTLQHQHDLFCQMQAATLHEKSSSAANILQRSYAKGCEEWRLGQVYTS